MNVFNRIKNWFRKPTSLRVDLVDYKPNKDSEAYKAVATANKGVLESILNENRDHKFEDLVSFSRLDDIAKREIYEAVRRSDTRLVKQNEQFIKKHKNNKALKIDE